MDIICKVLDGDMSVKWSRARPRTPASWIDVK